MLQPLLFPLSYTPNERLSSPHCGLCVKAVHHIIPEHILELDRRIAARVELGVDDERGLARFPASVHPAKAPGPKVC